MFFGALLSAIKSCASATLLAPSVTFTENILKPMLPKMADHEMLRTMRIVTLCFTLLVTLYAINSDASIFSMVENAYQITLVMAFVPLACGLYWKRATTQGAIVSVGLGIAVWVLFFPQINEAWSKAFPGQLAGLLAAFVGMVAGSLAPQYLRNRHEHVHHVQGMPATR